VELREFYRQVVQSEGPASFSDPDARWGFKKKDEPLFGYKAHVVCAETGIATGLTVTPGNEAELPQLPVLACVNRKWSHRVHRKGVQARLKQIALA
jgi:hypothetical protein